METNHRPVPVCEDTLFFFATYLAQQHISYPTIQVYLSAVRHNQVIASKPLPKITPRLDYVLKGIRRSKAITCHSKERLTITFPIITCLVFSKNPGNYRDAVIWAACCLAYFGLLRVCEFTMSSPDHFDPLADLLLSDVAIRRKPHIPITSTDYNKAIKRRTIQERSSNIFRKN